ncbi:MAG: 3-deoxy-7-phosphoheptulonate synthase [Ruminococcus sp.]|jgi:3-deoxy-7-phosphoheptulonate synthase|nr:3-deoxy-7-phosphoheptulonate synthase [Ruminococcus sp.]
MIVVLKKNSQENLVKSLIDIIESRNVNVNRIDGVHSTVLGLVGDTAKLDPDFIRAQDIVESVTRVQEPYKLANRKFHPDDTVISVDDLKIGGKNIQVIAGPCSVESEEQILETAKAVKAAGATMLRGGAFKPRTSPYAFQGLHADGIELLLKAKDITGLPIVTEIMSIEHLKFFKDVDIIQVGARNMQNFELLKELGKTDKPILLKRGLANTIEELLMSAEYVMAGGNQKVMLCERGIRTFETLTRNTFDVSAIPLLKQLSHLPIVSDPSHAAGLTSLVEPLSLAAIVAGTDALIIEVHNNPQTAFSDGAQSLTPKQFETVMGRVKPLVEFVGKA